MLNFTTCLSLEFLKSQGSQVIKQCLHKHSSFILGVDSNIMREREELVVYQFLQHIQFADLMSALKEKATL